MWRRMLSRSLRVDSQCSAVCHSKFDHFQHFQENVTGKETQRWGKAERRVQRKTERHRESKRKAKGKSADREWNRERQCLTHREACRQSKKRERPTATEAIRDQEVK